MSPICSLNIYISYVIHKCTQYVIRNMYVHMHRTSYIYILIIICSFHSSPLCVMGLYVHTNIWAMTFHLAHLTTENVIFDLSNSIFWMSSNLVLYDLIQCMISLFFLVFGSEL